LFCSRPDLIKFVASGCFLTASRVGTMMIIPTLKAEAWGNNMSRNSAIFDAMSGVMMMIFTPWFGCLSDRIQRRHAWLLTGCVGSVSVIALLIGGSDAGLWAYEISDVLTAPVRQVPAMTFIFLQDLVPPDDRNLIFAVTFAIFMAFTFLISLAAGIVANNTTGILGPCLFDFASLVLFIMATLSISKSTGDPVTRSGPGSPSSLEESRDSRRSSGNGSRQEGATLGSPRKATARSVGAQKSRAAGSTMRTVHFLCSSPNLRNLAFLFFLIGLPERLEKNIAPQFKFQAMDLMLTTNSTLNAVRIHEQKKVTELTGYTATFSMVFCSLLTGALGSAIGPLALTKLLVPLTAISQLLPLLLLVEPQMLLVGLVGLFAPLGQVVFIPLNALASICAPPDRVGEAISAMTAVKEFVPLLANLLTPELIALVGTSSLWTFFLTSGIMILLSLPFALDMKAVQSEEKLSEGKDDAEHNSEISVSSEEPEEEEEEEHSDV